MKHEEIENLEQKVREGRFLEVKQALSQFNLSRIPREQALSLANIAYRINSPNISIRILQPIIHCLIPGSDEPCDEELAEYSIALSRIGATDEALFWLDKVRNHHQKKVQLYRAFLCITKWEYQNAAIHLEEYLQSSDLTEYQRLVAQTNLAAAYVFNEEWHHAIHLLEKMRAETKRGGHKLLYANALELSAEVAYYTKNWSALKKFVDSGLEVAPSSTAQVYLQKWGAINELRMSSKNLNSIKNVMSQSEKLGLWECLRECNWYYSNLTHNQELFLKVYFGTPFEAFRNKQVRHQDFPFEIPQMHRLLLGINKFQRVPILNLQQGSLDGRPLFKQGSLVHNLLQILASDLYKPFRLGNLFSQLFPGEYYDPHTSPDRVHQILKRLRQALSETPLNIVAKKDLYSLNTQADVELSVTRTIQLKNAMELKIEQMIDHFGISQFSASEVKSLFNVSRTQAYYILQEAQKFGLSKTGQGVHSRYHFEIKRAS